MRVLLDYIRNVSGLNIVIFPLDSKLSKVLPLFISANYIIQETVIFDKRICLLEAKSQEVQTPDQLSKQMNLIESKINLPVVYVFKQVESYNLKRFIQKRINFIVPGKLMFIPSLLIDIRRVSVYPKKVNRRLTPIAQLLLLYHLQKETLGGLTTKQLADKLSYSYLMVNRAVKNLQDLSLCELIGGKEKRIRFSSGKKNLWTTGLQYMQAPVIRILFTDHKLTERFVCKSSINALSYYTDLNNENKHYYAIWKDDLKRIESILDDKYGENVIEIWQYDPNIMAEDGIVDKLSLYLLFKDSQDERIQYELDKLIQEMKW